MLVVNPHPSSAEDPNLDSNQALVARRGLTTSHESQRDVLCSFRQG